MFTVSFVYASPGSVYQCSPETRPGVQRRETSQLIHRTQQGHAFVHLRLDIPLTSDTISDSRIPRVKLFGHEKLLTRGLPVMRSEGRCSEQTTRSMVGCRGIEKSNTCGLVSPLSIVYSVNHFLSIV